MHQYQVLPINLAPQELQVLGCEIRSQALADQPRNRKYS